MVQAQENAYGNIVNIINLCYPNPQDSKVTKRNLLLSTVFVAETEGKIIGTVSCTRKKLHNGEIREIPEYRRNKMYYVWGLAVLPEYRKQGTGEQLFREAERFMYRERAKGYFGIAFSEEVAQWYVRTFGVRLRRLSLRYITAVGVPFVKKFQQEGIIDNIKRKLRFALFLVFFKKYK